MIMCVMGRFTGLARGIGTICKKEGFFLPLVRAKSRELIVDAARFSCRLGGCCCILRDHTPNSILCASTTCTSS
jgi:hypothetical protein